MAIVGEMLRQWTRQACVAGLLAGFDFLMDR